MNDITALVQRLELAAAKCCCHTLLPDDCRALVEALEKAQQHEQEWKSLCEAEAVDLDDWQEIDDKSRGLICKMADSIIALNERITSLESRTVTVKLTDVNEYLAEVHDKTLALTFRRLAEGVRAGDIAEMTAAGIQVIEGEG